MKRKGKTTRKDKKQMRKSREKVNKQKAKCKHVFRVVRWCELHSKFTGVKALMHKAQCPAKQWNELHCIKCPHIEKAKTW